MAGLRRICKAHGGLIAKDRWVTVEYDENGAPRRIVRTKGKHKTRKETR